MTKGREKMTERLLSIPEAARYLGVSRIRVWQWVHDARLPATRLGNYWFISPTDLHAFSPRKQGRPRKDRACA
jgi:excisionase family DNA binding protein